MKPRLLACVFLAHSNSLLRRATALEDADRLGTYVTGIPIYRTIGNTNTVQVSLGGQSLDLTLCESYWRHKETGSDVLNLTTYR